MRNLEAESIRNGGRVKLKTVTEIRWSSASDTFIAESVHLGLNSLLDWEPVEKFKQRCAECEHVIVLDVCCMMKCPTMLCLAKKKKKKKKKETEV